ncbi:MAG TPA: Uma2 family endonuclease [Ktedonosporobacter sp.]|jgi:Uma2 family endonuclease|nr:Uma2 family endonuclease [Ktedonosporobacter sp.]
MALEHQHRMTVEEYFQLEENDPDTRYEYVDGHAYAMAGGTANHDTIKSNIQRILWNLLRGSGCRVYSSDMKVYISETRYFHPDVIVTCDPRDRGTVQAIQSPRLVVEVLSPSTELTDRTWKLKNYRNHPTIEEYVLADAQSCKIEVYYKENSRWIYEAFENSDEIILHSPGVRFSLVDAYADVEFESPAGPHGLL